MVIFPALVLLRIFLEKKMHLMIIASQSQSLPFGAKIFEWHMFLSPFPVPTSSERLQSRYKSCYSFFGFRLDILLSIGNNNSSCWE